MMGNPQDSPRKRKSPNKIVVAVVAAEGFPQTPPSAVVAIVAGDGVIVVEGMWVNLREEFALVLRQGIGERSTDKEL